MARKYRKGDLVTHDIEGDGIVLGSEDRFGGVIVRFYARADYPMWLKASDGLTLVAKHCAACQ